MVFMHLNKKKKEKWKQSGKWEVRIAAICSVFNGFCSNCCLDV